MSYSPIFDNTASAYQHAREAAANYIRIAADSARGYGVNPLTQYIQNVHNMDFGRDGPVYSKMQELYTPARNAVTNFKDRIFGKKDAGNLDQRLSLALKGI